MTEKQIRFQLGCWALCAAAQAFRSLKFFYLGSHWDSFICVILKLIVICMVLRMAWAENSTKQDDSPANPLPLTICTFAFLISMLTDQAYLQVLPPHSH